MSEQGADGASETDDLPGVAQPSRFRPRFHYELLVCGLSGHELAGLGAAELPDEDAIFAREVDGVRWHRCLRCDGWLPFAPPVAPTMRRPPGRGEIELPLRGRPLRDRIVLRAIAIDRALHFLILSALSAGVFLIASNEVDLRDKFYAVLGALHGGLGGPTAESNGRFVDRIEHLLNLPHDKLQLIGLALAAYALVQGAEAVGLWLQRRWAEYLAVVSTSAFLPIEIYELIDGVTVLKVLALVINLAIVVYLLFAKRLFGLRGGAAADEALRERDVGWQALVDTAPEARARSR
ncbi:MAG: hypothetical protein QOI10_2988 [Solirubrobacterales bacterium]|jgi:uncharacterized membrane protein (DUF2068 family)|nr:hypothetical protein [Solirubrobacterales bacterium]